MIQELETIKDFNRILPIKELEKIRASKSKYIDALIDSIKYATASAKELCDGKSEYFLHIYALYLLAEFREAKAFPAAADFVELDKELYKKLSYDFGAEKLGCVMASMFNGDEQRLRHIIENKDAAEFARSSALNAYKTLVHEQVIPKKAFEKYLKEFIKSKLEAGPEDDQNAFVFITLVMVIMELNLYDLRFLVHEMYMNGFIDTWFVGDYADFIDEVFSEHFIKETFIEDAIDELMDGINFKNKKQYKRKTPKMNKSHAANQAQIDYPPIKGKNGLKGLSDFYDSDAIDIDIEMYKAMSKSKSYNMFFNALVSMMDGGDKSDGEDPLLKHFEKAYNLFLFKMQEDGIKRLKDYDKKHMIHYSIMEFFDEFFSFLVKESRRLINWDYQSRAIDIIEDTLSRFSLDRGYRAYLNRKLKKLMDIDEYPF